MMGLPNLSALSTGVEPYKESVLGPVDPDQQASPDMAVRFVSASDKQILDAIVDFVTSSTRPIMEAALAKFERRYSEKKLDKTRDLEAGTTEHTLQEVELCMKKLQMPTSGMRSLDSPDLSMYERGDETPPKPTPPAFKRRQHSEPNALIEGRNKYFAHQQYLRSKSLTRVQFGFAYAFLFMFKGLALIVGPVVALRLLLTTLANPTGPSDMYMLA
jgi:hypothetical protein